MKKLGRILAITMVCVMAAGCGGQAGSDETKIVKENNETSVAALSDHTLKNGDLIERQLTEEVLLTANIQIPETGLDSVETYHVAADGFPAAEYGKKMGINEPLENWEFREAGGFEPDRVYAYSGDVPVGASQMSGRFVAGFNIMFNTDHWMKKCSAYFPITNNINNEWAAVGNAVIDKDLAFMTKEEAAKEGEAFLTETLGIEGVNHLNTLAFSYQDMEAYQKQLYSDPTAELTGKPQNIDLEEWDGEDDSYWIFYETMFNGIPLVAVPVTRQDDLYVPSGQIELGITSTGVEMLRWDVHYKILGREQKALLTVDEACEALQKKFDMSITGKLTIDEMKLIYYPFPTAYDPKATYEYDLIPVWQFGYMQGKYRRNIYINALDGVEIVG